MPNKPVFIRAVFNLLNMAGSRVERIPSPDPARKKWPVVPNHDQSSQFCKSARSPRESTRLETNLPLDWRARAKSALTKVPTDGRELVLLLRVDCWVFKL